MPKLSLVSENAVQAMSIKYNTMVYELKRTGKNVLIMSLGEAYFDIPLFPFDDLKYPDLYHYSHSRGIPELREKLSEYFLKQYDIPVNYEKEMLITAGSKAAIHFAFMAIINPGDEVIVPEPAWVSYFEQISLCYGIPIRIPYNENVFDFEKYITKKTKAIVINTPHNPTGYVYKEDELRHLLKLCEKYNLWLLSDEAYSDFAPDGEFISPGKIDRSKKYTILFNSISKNYGISGWRLGYVIANENVIYNILKINQHLVTCPATILEFYVEKHFEDILRITLPQIKELLRKRKELSDYMDEIGLKYLEGNSTFYFFVSIEPSVFCSEDFCTKLLFDEYISTVPGLGYGISCDKFIRVSVGTASMEDNKYGLRKIKELIDKTTHDKIPYHKNVLVIGAGLWQVPLIKFLKLKGYKVNVVDPYLYSPGLQYADYHIKADVRDIGLIEELIKDMQFEFITSDQSDISVNTVSLLSEKRKLFSNSFKATNNFVNKVNMRETAKKLNIPIPNFKKILKIEDIKEFISKNGLPIIIKPADSQSSRGVFKIDKNNLGNLEKYFVESIRFSNCGFLIAEDFIEGFEITVEGIVNNNKHKSLAMSRKKHFRTSIASDLEYPADIPDELYKKIELVNDKFVENSGLSFGITHAEYFISKDFKKYFLIEIACRGGGSLISSDIAKWVSNVDLYSIFYDSLLGKIIDVKSILPEKRFAILHFFEFKEGKVMKINGIDDVKNLENVLSFDLQFKINDILQPASDDRSRQGYVVILSETKEGIKETLEKVYNLLKIEIE
jgi:aminotransferase